MTKMSYELVAALDEAEQEAINVHLRAFNRAHNAAFFKARDLPENAVNPLNVLARDAEGLIVGGLMAETQFLWLKISVVAVAEHLQRGGIGRGLVELAEQEAKIRRCRYAYVDTLSYQAPDFYRALGYRVAGTLENWDSHGHAKLLFTKQLV